MFQVLSWSGIVHILLPCDLVYIDVLHCFPYATAKSQSNFGKPWRQPFPEPELPVAERCSDGVTAELRQFHIMTITNTSDYWFIQLLLDIAT